MNEKEQLIHPLHYYKEEIPIEVFEKRKNDYITQKELELQQAIAKLEEQYANGPSRSDNRSSQYEMKAYNTSSGPIKIMRYYNSNNVLIRFINTGYTTLTTMRYIKNDVLKDPLKPSVLGIGFTGIGPYSSYDPEIRGKGVCYDRWFKILERCFSEKFLEKNPAYRGCDIDPYWFNFQNFATWYDWYTTNWPSEYDCRAMVDKDILVKGNKTYGPDKCCIVPETLNVIAKGHKAETNPYPGVKPRHGKYSVCTSFYGKNTYLGTRDTLEEAIHLYNTEKTKYVRELADSYGDNISPDVYNALLHYYEL